MERCNILLLDEDEDDYCLVKCYLEEAFHKTVTLDWFQRVGFAALMICSGYYLLTLIEFQINGENGLDVISMAREKCPDQAIIVLSSWDRGIIPDEYALQAGADMVLRKDELSVEKVREVLSPYLETDRCPEKT